MSEYVGVNARSTMGGTASPPSQLKPDRQASQLDEIAMQLDSLINQFNSINQRMYETGARAIGHEPEKPATANPTPEPVGVVGLINLKLGQLNSIVEQQNYLIGKIERVL